MSTILKALKSKEETEKPETQVDEKELLFVSQKYTNTDILFMQKKKVFAYVILSAVSFCLGAGFWGFRSFSVEDKAERTPQAIVPIEMKVEKMPEVDLKKAYALMDRGELDKSLSLLQRASIAYPKRHKIQNGIGYIFLKKGAYSNAQASLMKAISLNPNCSECFNNLGHLKMSLGDRVEAEHYFKKAISIDKTYADPYFNLGVLWDKEGNGNNASFYYKKFIKKYSKNKNLIQKVKHRIQQLEK